MTLVKICGLQNEQDIKSAVSVKVDFVGFVFATSKRQITMETAAKLVKELPGSIKKVGVFVNPTLEEVKEAINKVPLDLVQLHGEETGNFIEQIPIPTIKAIKIVNGKPNVAIGDYPKSMILLDAPTPGDGKTFSWDKTDLAILPKERLIIAGGLQAANVQAAIHYFHPLAVDVSSGVETNQQKDPQKINAFIKAVKESENEL
ncbi:phosphoribosylanthranilate isomerase [Listeria sp. PSOL-1]|uniref:phosphoribosylanthranilate isomerase n=1 Tax=Listeria sp. PSOL-1 TaxID=1844999 RepID=UPI0013D41FBB|nr:phosphoribosylanthranilate isomerase [Listeria sp. PSOL-1]